MKLVQATFLACVPALAIGGSALADIVSIGEFTGDVFENFEGISAPAPWPGPMPIFGGAATFDDQFSDPWIANSLTGGGETMFAYDGSYMGLAPTGWTRWLFDTPVYKFGGFFATTPTFQGVDGRVRFLDASGGVIETVSFSTPAGEWTWHGWQSDVAFSGIEIESNVNPGTTTVYDNFTASYVPAPGAIALLMCGAGVMRRRRR